MTCSGKLQYPPQPERFVQQGDIDVGDLDAALRDQPDERFGFELLEGLAKRADGDLYDLAEFALRDELPGLEGTREKPLLEPILGLVAQHRLAHVSIYN